jgi:ABC-type polysaccharide/polyol phosphate transport system ATPase subunit
MIVQTSMIGQAPGMVLLSRRSSGRLLGSFERVSATVTHLPAQRARSLAGASPAVTVDSVSKAFRLPHQRFDTLKEKALHPFAARTHDSLQALQDVSCEVKRGEFFGVVGRNGSGKSTLLKCLAGIYGIDSGSIDVVGRLSPFIELGVGFNPDLTARDNVVINAIMLGLTRREARRRFDEIIEFAELEEFVDLKLKNYSSGMGVRLGFSVAIQVDADVILVDEVLAVGDAAFQRKCFDQFERLRAEGRTILFVTHDMNSVERFCDRAMLIERGRVLAIGEPADITRHYNEVNFGQSPADRSSVSGVPDDVVRLGSTWCEDDHGDPILAAEYGDSCTVCMEVEFLQTLDNAVFGVIFRNEVRHTIFVPTSGYQPVSGPFARGEKLLVRLSFDNWLATSRYTLTPTVATLDPDYRVLDQREDVASLVVESPFRTGGAVDIPTSLEIERL